MLKSKRHLKPSTTWPLVYVITTSALILHLLSIYKCNKRWGKFISSSSYNSSHNRCSYLFIRIKLLAKGLQLLPMLQSEGPFAFAHGQGQEMQQLGSGQEGISSFRSDNY